VLFAEWFLGRVSEEAIIDRLPFDADI